MKATSRTTKTKRKRRTGRATAAPRTSFGKLSLREISETSDGYKWTSYLVQGFRDEAGRHGRKKFKTRDDALAWIATKGVELVNTDTALHNVVTRLSKTQVEEAESAFTRLAGRHALGEAVDFFMRNYAQPDTPTPLDRALEAFLENREREGVRPRSLVQLRSTGSQFIGFVTLAKVPTALVPEIDRVRAELEANRAASLVEVIRALPADLRPSARAASEDLDTVLDLLRKRDLSPALHAWLTRYGGDIWPTNADRMAKHIRNRFALPHDVLRHSFFSYLVGSEGSVERAALEGGNTESILRRHYLNLTNTDEAADFWQILPPGKKSKVVKVKFA